MKILLKISVLFLLFLIPGLPVVASTFHPYRVPWGTKNNYNTNLGLGLVVGAPFFIYDGSELDILTGACNGTCSGICAQVCKPVPGDNQTCGVEYDNCYPNEPSNYYRGFELNKPINFRVQIKNDNADPNSDNYWFMLYKVNFCNINGKTINSPDLTEKELNDCSQASGWSNQSPVLITNKTQTNFQARSYSILSYTWNSTQTGYYQFDFNSDGYSHDFPNATSFAAGFIRVIEAPTAPTPTPTISASCREIKAYNLSWNQLTSSQLTQLKAGDKVRFAVSGQITGSTISKARLRINNGAWQETATKKPGSEEFYIEYTIPSGVTSFTVEAEIYYVTSDGGVWK